MQFGGKLRSARFDDLATEHHVRAERNVVLEQLFVVRDDEDAHLSATDAGDALAGEPDGVGVEAAVSLVEDRKLGAEHSELEDLGPLHLAAGESVVDVPSGEFRVDRKISHLRLEFVAEVPHRHQLLTLFAIGITDVGHRMPQKVGQPHTRDRHRPLEGEKDTGAGPLIGLHREQVVPGAIGLHQFDRTGRDFIGRVAHDAVAQRALAGAVGAH